ncbi:MAG: WG repeat-containing protein [Kiritimatiellae bacterium]|nr:WG repeat-containing protein [Kiritimatiellia bacterium]
MTLDGKWPIPAVFDEARSFKRGCAPVRKDGKWGFIDKSGKAATPFAYDDVKDVRDGHFRAKIGEKWGLFAIDGTCKLPAEYDDILADGEYVYGGP